MPPTTTNPALAPVHPTRIPALQRDVRWASALQRAVLAKEPAAALALCDALVSHELDDLERFASAEELDIRRTIHEIVDDALRVVVFTHEAPGEEWRRVFLPDEFGLFEFPMLMSNAVWLRRCGSRVPDENSETLQAAQLKALTFKQQALAVGRFCLCNDGRADINYAAVIAVLDPRLIASFNNWLLTVHCLSPNRVAEEDSEQNQTRALQEFLELAQLPHDPLPASSSQSAASFEGAYWTEGSVRKLSEELNGRQIKNLYRQFHPNESEEGPRRVELDALENTDTLVICPNWHDEHVIHRCLSPLTEGLRREGALNLRVFGAASAGRKPKATDWGEQSIDVLHSEQFVLTDLSLISRRIRNSGIDFAFYPEIVPSNSSSWMATERVARVQATGYGFPVTSGLATMDYFVGGAAVEPKETVGNDHTEQLVLLPGLGVSTTPPPVPQVKRLRPVDDAQVHICATCSQQKLGTNLLRAWDSIQQGESNTSLSLFTNMTEAQASARSAAIGKLLVHGDVDLNCSIPRADLIGIMADADLYLDSFPYGGFNSLVEVLVCGVPVLTLEGDQARNRFGAAILRRLGLPEFLIAKSYDAYVLTAKRLIRDAGLRQEIRDKLGSPQSVLSKLADPDMSHHFDAAVEWMRQQGPRGLSRRAPVLIEAGEKPRFLIN